MMILKINTEKKHKISPYLYMQFMEPLGIADASVDAGWDYIENEWRPALMERVKELAPTMVRFGGCFASYYHWREAVGPRAGRVPMHNHCWGGMFMNQVGTHEVVDFCRQINAQPLIVVNMESEGIPEWQNPKNDTCRMGTAEEAADWVSYCNDPDNAERIAHGVKEPYNIKYWQIGNETSYTAGYGVNECFEATERFAKAMRERDPLVKLIGWADTGRDRDNWCRKMSGAEGIDMLAFHHHFDSGLPDSPFTGVHYRDDTENTWNHLMNAYKSLDDHIRSIRADAGDKRLAITEGHFVLGGRNRNEVLSSWGAGVAYARCLNTIMRHSDVVDIATMADFFGTVWQVNAILMKSSKKCYLQPVGSVMSLFGKHQGEYALDCSYSGAVDAVCSATDGKVFIHIANTDMHASQEIKLDLDERWVIQGKMYYISANPATEVTPDEPNVFAVKKMSFYGDTVTLPPAAVAAIEISLDQGERYE